MIWVDLALVYSTILYPSSRQLGNFQDPRESNLVPIPIGHPVDSLRSKLSSAFVRFPSCSRSAVIRGRVVTSSGRGLVGVRVTHSEQHGEGYDFKYYKIILLSLFLNNFIYIRYTMTQSDGWFDFMVNGGGAVGIQFGKSPFRPKEKNVFVPWNEVRDKGYLGFSHET